MSEAASRRRASDATKKAISDGHKGKPYPKNRASSPLPEQVKRKISAALIGHTNSPTGLKARQSFTGGQYGEDMAGILAPCGFLREKAIKWGPLRYDIYYVDFLHLDAKVVIELDGPWHAASVSADTIRDYVLQTLGYKVIRIKHA